MKKDEEKQRCYFGEQEIFDYPKLDESPVVSQQFADYQLPKELQRDKLEDFPQLGEGDLVRHFSRLSSANYHLGQGLYPLGSCTMKYNPKINDKLASLEGFLTAHPYEDEVRIQGILAAIYQLEEMLAKITGLAAVSLQPAAGAHGELCGMKIIHAALNKEKSQKSVVLIPDSAHGTNPSSCALSGFTVLQVKSGSDGRIDLADFKSKLSDNVAAIMITNPNTLGVFESQIKEISEAIHQVGGYVYGDGANLNAVICKLDFLAAGVDVLHINLHKTFSTPHGGGGPGAGPVAVCKKLAPFLPGPRVVKEGENYKFNYDLPQSIGRIKAFHGNFGVCLRALSYILKHGAKGLEEVAEGAVVNANYLRSKLSKFYHLQYQTETLHETVFDDSYQQENGVRTMDIAKRLLDFGFHPPTVYFPLIVKGAMMIEPTETENIEELDRFVKAMQTIAQEAEEEAQTVKTAPHNIGLKRIDEATAARKLDLRWKKEKENS